MSSLKAYAMLPRGEFQITTDGFAPYRFAIPNTLEDRCDFAKLIKVYHAPQDGEKRYSPAEVSAVEVVPIMGRPDPERICTSIVERSNLSTRMSVRQIHPIDKCLLQEVEESLGCCRVVVRLL